MGDTCLVVLVLAALALLGCPVSCEWNLPNVPDPYEEKAIEGESFLEVGTGTETGANWKFWLGVEQRRLRDVQRDTHLILWDIRREMEKRMSDPLGGVRVRLQVEAGPANHTTHVTDVDVLAAFCDDCAQQPHEVDEDQGQADSGVHAAPALATTQTAQGQQQEQQRTQKQAPTAAPLLPAIAMVETDSRLGAGTGYSMRTCVNFLREIKWLYKLNVRAVRTCLASQH